MAYIRQRFRKDGTPFWQVCFDLDGKQSAQSFVGSGAEDEARRFHALIDSLHDARRALEIWGIALPPVEVANETVLEWLNYYVQHITGARGPTLKLYRAYIDNDLADTLGRLPLTALTYEDVHSWVKGLEAGGNSAKTVANKHGFLSGALSAAVPKRIPHNPCAGIPLPHGQAREMVFLTPAEYRQLKAAFKEHWHPFLDFLVTSGCRFSEATALTPADVDRQAGRVSITKAWKRGGEMGAPKTRRSRRTISVDSDVLDRLGYSRPWLFTSRGRGDWRQASDGRVTITGFYERVWVPGVARSGLAKRPRIHDLRHTCASWMIARKNPLPVIQRHLGHESIKTTVDRYGHLDDELSRIAAAGVAADALG